MGKRKAPTTFLGRQKFKALKYLDKNPRVKYSVYGAIAMLWLLGARYLGAVFICISIIVAIFASLGERKDGPSAYSGDFQAEQMTGGSVSQKLTAGLQGVTPGKVKGHLPCPCGSASKAKRCCYKNL